MTKSSGEIIRTSLMTGGAGGIGMAIKNKFNLNNSPKALLRGVQFTSPLEERSELPFRAVLGEVKYKISVFDPEVKMKQAKYLYGFASRIVCFKKFFISNHIKVALTDIMIPTDITFPFLECDIRDAKQVENLYQWVNDIIDVSDISSCIITDYWRGIELFFETDKEIAYLKSIKPPHP